MISIILHSVGKLFAALFSLLGGGIVIIAVSLAMAGVGLLGFQILLWLIGGTWTSYALADVIKIIGSNLGSSYYQQDLFGLGKSLGNLANSIPLSSFLIVAGLLMSASVAYIYDGFRDRLRRERVQSD